MLALTGHKLCTFSAHTLPVLTPGSIVCVFSYAAKRKYFNQHSRGLTGDGLPPGTTDTGRDLCLQAATANTAVITV